MLETWNREVPYLQPRSDFNAHDREGIILAAHENANSFHFNEFACMIGGPSGTSFATGRAQLHTNHIARNARNASVAVGPCPFLPPEPLTARVSMDSLIHGGAVQTRQHQGVRTTTMCIGVSPETSIARQPPAAECSTVCLIEASARSSDVRVLSTTAFRSREPLTPVSPSCCDPFSVNR